MCIRSHSTHTHTTRESFMSFYTRTQPLFPCLFERASFLEGRHDITSFTLKVRENRIMHILFNHTTRLLFLFCRDAPRRRLYRLHQARRPKEAFVRHDKIQSHHIGRDHAYILIQKAKRQPSRMSLPSRHRPFFFFMVSTALISGIGYRVGNYYRLGDIRTKAIIILSTHYRFEYHTSFETRFLCFSVD